LAKFKPAITLRRLLLEECLYRERHGPVILAGPRRLSGVAFVTFVDVGQLLNELVFCASNLPEDAHSLVLGVARGVILRAVRDVLGVHFYAYRSRGAVSGDRSRNVHSLLQFCGRLAGDHILSITASNINIVAQLATFVSSFATLLRFALRFAPRLVDSHISRMSIRLWRRKTLFPGMRVNLSRSGVSLSVGRRGAWFTAGPRGRRATVGWPGTGLFWTQQLSVPHAVKGRQDGSHSLAEALALAVAHTFIAFCAIVSALFIISFFVHGH
jgi:hypothetical protein